MPATDGARDEQAVDGEERDRRPDARRIGAGRGEAATARSSPASQAIDRGDRRPAEEGDDEPTGEPDAAGEDPVGDLVEAGLAVCVACRRPRRRQGPATSGPRPSRRRPPPARGSSVVVRVGQRPSKPSRRRSPPRSPTRGRRSPRRRTRDRRRPPRARGRRAGAGRAAGTRGRACAGRRTPWGSASSTCRSTRRTTCRRPLRLERLSPRRAS